MSKDDVILFSENDFKFLEDIRKTFPTFIGGVIADENGFVVASCKDQICFDEEILALSTITNRDLHEYYAKMGFEEGSYIKVKRDLNNHLKLCILLNKDPVNLPLFKELNRLLERKLL
ncbi:MAG: hypothetical protein RBG13Loki_3324 [Promethearchaeota archaeon CR_4]|nr:MAG: hypothetical protein RBG13Loki_3324 [Candidatus Lokiarchaeota archaeon CR_4]